MPWTLGTRWPEPAAGESACVDDLFILGTIVQATNLASATDVVVDGTTAFCTSFGQDRLTTIDVTNPASMSLISSITNSHFNQTRGLVQAGSNCFVVGTDSSTNGHLAVVNVSNPASMSVTGSITDATLLGAFGICKVGNFCYVAAGGGGGIAASDRLTVVDVSTLATPTIAGSLQDTTNLLRCRGVVVESGLAYVAVSGGDRLTVVDVSNPASMSVVGSLNHATLTDSWCVVKDGNYCFVGCQGGVVVVDVSSPASMSIVDSVGGFGNVTSPHGLIKVGDLLFASVDNATPGSVHIIDVADPTDIIHVNGIYSSTVLSRCTGIFHQSGILYVAILQANSLTTIQVDCIDCTTSTFGVAASIAATGATSLQKGIIDGDVLFTTDFSSRVRAWDIADPFNITAISNVQDTTNLLQVRESYLVGTVLFGTSDSTDRITAVDVSNPASMSVISSLQDSTNLDGATLVGVSGGVAFVNAQTINSLTAVDVSNPASMSFISKVTNATTLNGPNQGIVSGSIVYTSVFGNRFTTVDVSNPASMSVISSITNATTLSGAGRLIKDGIYCYVLANGGSGLGRLTVVDVSNPASMTITASITDGRLNGQLDLVKVGDLLYVTANTADQVVIINVANPAAPVIVKGIYDQVNLDAPHRIAYDSTDGFFYVTGTSGAGPRITVLGVSEDCSAPGGSGTGSGWSL